MIFSNTMTLVIKYLITHFSIYEKKIKSWQRLKRT